MHEGIATLDRDGSSVIAQIDQFKRQSPHEATVDFRSVQKRQAHTPILALSCEVGHVLRRRENNFVGIDVAMLQIMQSDFFLDGQYVTIAVEKSIVVWIDHFVTIDQFNQLVLTDYTHVLAPLAFCNKTPLDYI
jgi:hypothetical protein